MKNFAICVLLAALTGVVRTRNPIVFDLEASLRNTPKATTLNDIAEEISYTPLETHKNALLGGGNRMAVTGGDIYIDNGTSRSPIYRFDAQGKFVRQMTHIGRGPGEYIMSLMWYANASRHTINVVDPVGGNHVVVPTEGGRPTGVKRNNSDGIDMIPLVDGTFLSYKDLPATRREPAKLSLRFFDERGQLAGSVERRVEHAPETPSMEVKSIFESHERPLTWSNYRGEALLHIPYNDTLFTVRSRSEAIAPLCVFKRGRFAPDHKGSRDKQKCVYYGDVNESGDHVCLLFSYDGKSYFDIWSKRDGRLVIRRAREEGGKSGFPFRLPDGAMTYLAVAYADRDRLYCVMQAVDACRFLPGVKEDDNPVIVTIKLK